VLQARLHARGPACLALLALAACGDTTEERAATGALRGAVTGTVVGGPVGAAVGAAAGAATSTVVGKAIDNGARDETVGKEG
jgi:osmotically inducible lipoprotein OsmB